MLRLIMACGLMAVVASAQAQTFVNGYVRSNGTYVQPHYRSTADDSTFNNYSTQGNVNPYTGQAGTQNPYNANTTTGASGNMWNVNTQKSQPNMWNSQSSGWGQ